jgi:hypothetical protein
MGTNVTIVNLQQCKHGDKCNHSNPRTIVAMATKVTILSLQQCKQCNKGNHNNLRTMVSLVYKIVNMHLSLQVKCSKAIFFRFQPKLKVSSNCSKMAHHRISRKDIQWQSSCSMRRDETTVSFPIVLCGPA